MLEGVILTYRNSFLKNTKALNTSFTLPSRKVDTNKVFFLIKTETGVVFHNIRKKGNIFFRFLYEIFLTYSKNVKN